jgi:hypothetical protein
VREYDRLLAIGCVSYGRLSLDSISLIVALKHFLNPTRFATFLF